MILNRRNLLILRKKELKGARRKLEVITIGRLAIDVFVLFVANQGISLVIVRTVLTCVLCWIVSKTLVLTKRKTTRMQIVEL